MPAGQMFGSPVGTNIFNTEQANMLQVGTNAMHKLGEIAMQPAKLREQEADAGIKEMQLKQQQRLEALLAARAAGQSPTGKDGKPLSVADELSSFGMDLFNAGDIKQGRELIQASSLVRAREARADAQRITGEMNSIKAAAAEAALQGQILANDSVVDQASWEQAQAAYFVHTGGQAPFAGVPFSAELVKSLRSQALTTAEAARLAEQRLTREAADKRGTALERIRKEQLEVAKRNAKTREEAEARKAKVGAPTKPTTPASKSESEAARRLAKRDFPELGGADLDDASFAIANAAKQLRQRNPALSMDMAIQQAYNDAKAAGDFTETSNEVAGIKFNKKQLYTGRGKSAAAPLPPPTKDTKRIDGRYYQLPNGQVGVWRGTGWELAGGLSKDNSRPDPEDDDDEDDETE